MFIQWHNIGNTYLTLKYFSKILNFYTIIALPIWLATSIRKFHVLAINKLFVMDAIIVTLSFVLC